MTRAGKPVALSAGLTAAKRLPGMKLLTQVWGYSATTDTRTVDVHVGWFRQKLEENPKYPRYLQTVRGLGYKLSDEEL